MDYIKIINQTFLGPQMTENEINVAFNTGNFLLKHFKKGKMLHLEGEECVYLEILLKGSIVNMQIDQYGNEIIIKSFERAEVLAGNILFGTFPKYPLTFITESDGCLLQINKTFLFELLSTKPIILRQFLLLISDRAITFGSKLKRGVRKPLRHLIMEYLRSQSIAQNSCIITLPISKTELANRFEVQRTSVSREFTRMEKDGLITIFKDKKTIEILNPDL